MLNRVRTKRPIRFRNRGDSPLSPATPGNRELLLKLAQELQQMTIESMEGLGVSRKEQMVTYRRASKGVGSKDRPSTRLMDRISAIADLLSSWRRDKRYVQADGSPRVLPIHGKGASLSNRSRLPGVVGASGESPRLRKRMGLLVGTRFGIESLMRASRYGRRL